MTTEILYPNDLSARRRLWIFICHPRKARFVSRNTLNSLWGYAAARSFLTATGRVVHPSAFTKDYYNGGT